MRPFENSSDDEDENEFVGKSGFYRKRQKEKKEEVAILPYPQPGKRSKSVKFKEDNEQFTKPLEKIHKIVKK